MPLTTLFTPERNMDLGLLIKDQIFMRQISEFLLPLAGTESIKQEAIVQRFKGSELIKEIRGLFKKNPEAYLSYFYGACLAVLTHQPSPNLLDQSLQGRIFTLRNALIAQTEPEMVRGNQSQNNIPQQTISMIQEEGASFIREVLRYHLEALSAKESVPFRGQLEATTSQLIPFVRDVTKRFLLENGRAYPDDPLTFRDPTGNNYQGRAAATIMGACLQALGFKARVMYRGDLDPLVTLATLHSIVEVTSPDNQRYVVDPCYKQFYKDILLDDTSLPTSPVLVLPEGEMDAYVERNLMSEWKKTRELFRAGDPTVMRKLTDRDQWYSFAIDQMKKSWSKRGFPDPEIWTKRSLQRVWDLSTYSQVLGNFAFQEIFIGLGEIETHTTYDWVRPLGIAPLTQYLSCPEVGRKLLDLAKIKALQGKNHPEAVFFLAQAPFQVRSHFSTLLDVDPRISDRVLETFVNAYFRSLRRVVNPEGSEKRVVYGCSGADCMSVLLSTDATDMTFVDVTKVSCQEVRTRCISRSKTVPCLLRRQYCG
jgi:hypothetical protein